MKAGLISLLFCPECHCGFKVQGVQFEGKEIIEGNLICSGCGLTFAIVRGIPRFINKELSIAEKATSDAFSYEWTHYSRLTEADGREFLAWISPLVPSDFESQVVLDAGCGKGRHLFQVAKYGARAVVGFDLSDAVEAAYQNTRELPNAHVIQADIGYLPLRNHFDIVYSIGVLHHLPVPKAGFLALTKHVRPGGRLSTWVYGKEGNLWIEMLVDPVRKKITSRLPKPLTRVLSFGPSCVLYAALNCLYGPARSMPWLKQRLPYSDYLCTISDYSFAENFWNVFDQLMAPTAFYHSREEVVDWFASARVEQVAIERHNGNSWRGTAVISDVADGDDPF